DFVNEHSGFAVAPAHYIAFAELRHARPAALYHCGSEPMKPQPDVEFAAFAGIDWSETKHDICVQAANSGGRELAVVPHRPAAIDAWAKRAATNALAAGRRRCAWSSPRGRSSTPCRSTISWCSSRFIPRRSRNTARRSCR